MSSRKRPLNNENKSTSVDVFSPHTRRRRHNNNSTLNISNLKEKYRQRIREQLRINNQQGTIIGKQNKQIEYLLDIFRNGRNCKYDEILKKQYSSDKLYKLFMDNNKSFNQIKVELNDPFIEQENVKKIIEQNISYYIFTNGSNLFSGIVHSDPVVKVDETDGYRRSQIFEIYDGSNEHKIEDLFNPNRTYVKANVDIKKHSVLGLYDGNKLTVEEFNLLYYGTDILDEINCYAMDVKCDNESHGYIIDPKGYFNCNVENNINSINNKKLIFGSYINDTRNNQLQPRTDIQSNIMVLNCKINNWPALFIVASKDINRDDKLYFYYGKEIADNIKNIKIKQKSQELNYQQIVQEMNNIN